MITLSILLQEQELVCALVEAHKFTSPRVFGSVVTGSNTAESDVDLLVEALPGASGLDLVALEQKLSEAFGVRFDVNTPKMLRKSWRQDVLDGAVSLGCSGSK